MSLVETYLPFPNAVKQTTTVKVPTAHVQLISIQIQLLKDVPQNKLKFASSWVIKHSMPMAKLTDSMLEVTKSAMFSFKFLK